MPDREADAEGRERASGVLLGDGGGEQVPDLARRRPQQGGIVGIGDVDAPPDPLVQQVEVPLAEPAPGMAVRARLRP